MKKTAVVDDVIELRALLEETRERLRVVEDKLEIETRERLQLVEDKLEVIMRNFLLEGSKAWPSDSQVKHVAEGKLTSEDAQPKLAIGQVKEVAWGMGAPALWLRTVERSAESTMAEVQGIEQLARVKTSVEESELDPETSPGAPLPRAGSSHSEASRAVDDEVAVEPSLWLLIDIKYES
mgnify:CR=1 FL=1